MQYEPQIRLACSVGVFAIMALWELAGPRRALTVRKGPRWFVNLSLVVIDTLVVRLLFPIAAVGMAELSAVRGWGALNMVHAPYWLALTASFIALDFIVYVQHVLFHYVPFFWRFHRVHHADVDFDVTTGLRFHPGEIALSMCIKLGAVALLGPPMEAVVAFEVALNATSLFNHSNVRIPLTIDRALRFVVVTPDMHRVHHSVVSAETNSNFGFNLPWWDRLCGTYTAQPRDGHTEMAIGLDQFRDRISQRLVALLWLPIIKQKRVE
ncbi:MAG: sterol desaturase family protein [Candidatus Hydrogenedentes bacterium]|nr:sterol desaturase family protein [Candidatus Hydrogenedentota bacterium]